MTLTTMELFAGAGGMALGVERARFQHEVLVEFNPSACQTLRLNRPGWPVLDTDVADVDFGGYAGIDLLTAGAPCQPFSTAGKRRLDRDKRNMFPQVFRAIRSARPRAVLLENVKGMLIGDARVYFDHVIGRLGDLGYDTSWRLVNCADYGVPQRRERIFVVGLRRDLGVQWTWPVPTHGLDALLHAQGVDGSYWREHDLPAPDDPPFSLVERVECLWPSHLPPPRHRWRTVRDALADLHHLEVASDPVIASDSMYGDPKVHSLDGPALTITTRWEKALVRDGQAGLRYLTTQELGRLQAFPDSWTFSGKPEEQLRQVGNAVPADVAHTFAGAIAQRLLGAAKAQVAA